MVKQSKVKKQEKLGKGKVTPIQIAFIVDRYLANNNYSATLASFRSEAADLLSRTQGKEAPKGLMGLADILDDYISLKEHRLMIDREKQRVETALQGMQEVMRAYHSGAAVGSVPAPLPVSPPIPPQGVASPMVPLFSMSNLGNGSPPGHMMLGPSTTNHTQPPALLTMAGECNKQLAPTDTQSSTEKRRASKPATKEALFQKKPRTELPAVSNTEEARHTSSEACTRNALTVQTKSADKLSTLLSVHGLSLVKTVGSQRNSSSPKTPPQGFSSQMNQSVSPVQNSAPNDVDTDISQKLMTSSNCALVSSETLIISPMKVKGYYAVERSCRVTYSPLKTSPKKLCKREQIKGRLDFDGADVLEGSQKPCADISTSSSDQETPLSFDFELPDFEIFDGDFLSGLLIDIGDDYDGVSNCLTGSANAITGPEQDGGECLETKQTVPDSSPSKDAGCSDAVTSVRAITKRIKILSPVKRKGT